jgi:outer membrane protein TolC
MAHRDLPSSRPSGWQVSAGEPIRPPAGVKFGRLAVGLAVLALMIAGCSRARYRERADAQVYGLVDCGARDPRWARDCYTIEVNPRSRMYDPYDPDCPPMPPDDPTSHQLMQCVDGKRGWPCWDQCGVGASVENPAWRSFLPYDEEGLVVLDRQAAVELALLESPDYQQELEDLYLSALSVTLERFQFQMQFFGGNSTFFTAEGPLSGQAGSSSRLGTDTALGFTRAFAAGGQLLVEAANSVVWEFSGADSYNALTPISFSFFQPLLRGAGRAVVLESLTDSERALLANIRQLERFRRGFYVETVAGRNPGPGPGTGRLGLGSFAAGGGSGVGGYLSLLEQQLQIRNQRANVTALRDSFDQINEFYKAGRIRRTQVDEVLQNLYSSQIDLLSRTTSYEDQLDSYKVGLGLPPQLEVRIEDPLLRPFNLIDPELTAVQEGVSSRLAELRKIDVEVDSTIDPQRLEEIYRKILVVVAMIQNDIDTLEAKLPDRREELRQLSRREEFQREEVDPRLVDTSELDLRVEQLKEDFAAMQPQIRATLGVAQYRARQFQASIDTLQESMEEQSGGTAADWFYLAMAYWQLDQKEQAERWFTKASDWTETNEPNDQRLARLRAEVATMMGQADNLPDWVRALDSQESPQELQRQRLIRLLSRLSDELGQLSLVQAGARLDTAALVSIELPPDAAIEIARRHRLDWMNARAALVDRWRRVEIVANQLKSDLDVVVSGDLTPRSDTGANIHNTTGSIRVGLEFDAPLNRLAERNDYRAVLIDYQRARREYYGYEDRVAQVLRDELRSIRLSQLQFELQRAAVRTAITRVDQQRTQLREPPRAGQEDFTLGATTARDLLTALSSLLREQNSFLNSWVRYEVLRMDLDFDLGTMQLDNRGMWIDPGPIDLSRLPEMEEVEDVPAPEGVLPLRLDMLDPNELPSDDLTDLFAVPPPPVP